MRIASILLVAVLLYCMPCHAGERLCDPYDSDSCIKTVHQGEIVPFSGQLLTPARSRVISQALEQCREWTAQDKPNKGVDNTCVNQQTIWRLLLESERYDRKQAEELLMRRVRTAEKEPEWYETKLFIGVASAVGATLFVLAVH